MALVVKNLQRKLAVDCRLLQRQAEHARDLFESGRYQHHDLTIALTDNFHIKVLNAKYALTRKSTDVLTFRLADTPPRHRRVPAPRTLEQHLRALQSAPFLDPASGSLIPPHAQPSPDQLQPVHPQLPKDLGVIFLSVQYCHRLAHERQMRPRDYLLLATVHGLAHLVGHAHNTRASRKAMKTAEMDVLDALRDTYGFENDQALAQTEGKPFMPRSYLP